jgi:preprotein translocase subunit SecG
VTVLLVILYVLVCLFLILVVLLQQGKGADLAGAFGGGGSQTSFGPRSGTNIMHRMTTVAFILFVVLCLALAILSGKQRASVLEGMAPQVQEESTTVPDEPALGTAEDGSASTGEGAAATMDPATGEAQPNAIEGDGGTTETE